jgi:hypothetical protein
LGSAAARKRLVESGGRVDGWLEISGDEKSRMDEGRKKEGVKKKEL